MGKRKKPEIVIPKSFSEPTEVKTRSVNVFDNPGFRFTTPSANPKTGAKLKREIGCVHNGKKFTGQRCADGSSSCGPDNQVYDNRCKPTGKPACELDKKKGQRKTCPVQFVWVEGKPNLRFCLESDNPGYLVPVANVSEAMRISEEACAKWPYKLKPKRKDTDEEDEKKEPKTTSRGWPPGFFDINAPQIRSAAQSAYPQSQGLGNFAGGNPLWIVGGAALGLLATMWFVRGKGVEASASQTAAEREVIDRLKDQRLREGP